MENTSVETGEATAVKYGANRLKAEAAKLSYHVV